jgi:hypothetical protein
MGAGSILRKRGLHINTPESYENQFGFSDKNDREAYKNHVRDALRSKLSPFFRVISSTSRRGFLIAPTATAFLMHQKDYINSTLAISSDRSGRHSILPLLNKTDFRAISEYPQKSSGPIA